MKGATADRLHGIALRDQLRALMRYRDPVRLVIMTKGAASAGPQHLAELDRFCNIRMAVSRATHWLRSGFRHSLAS